MRQVLLAIMVSVLFVSQTSAASTTTIVMLGDSLTAGYGVAPEDAFPARLDEYLRQHGYDVRVINAGVSGDTTAGGLVRLDPVIAQKPDIVIIELGGNDLLRGLPPAEIRRNLDAILTRLQAQHIRMILTGAKAPFTLGRAYADAYNALFPDLAKQYKALLYPSFLEGVYGNAALMQPDGIHPNKDGVVSIVSHFAPLVESMLRK